MDAALWNWEYKWDRVGIGYGGLSVSLSSGADKKSNLKQNK